MRSKIAVCMYVIIAVGILVLVSTRLRAPASPANVSHGESSGSERPLSDSASSEGGVDHGAAGASSSGVDAPGEGKGAQGSVGDKEEKKEGRDSAPPLPAPLDYGRIQPVRADANRFVAQAVETVRTGKAPHRVSMLIDPPPFDGDVEKQTKTIAPGRCLQVADPGPDTPQLVHVGPRSFRAKQDETVVLRARTTPNGCVTFTSLNAGAFSTTKLATVTVAADKHGVAEAKFSAGPGVAHDLRIVAGSPTASHTVSYLLIVDLPDSVVRPVSTKVGDQK